MSNGEIFPNPTVKQVIFQIRFPNLFYVENNIGTLQLKIMSEFPESRLLYSRSVVFADLGPDVKPVDVAADIEGEPTRKIWEFKSPKDVKLNVLSNSLDITSQHHKTYNNQESEERFRDVIEFAVGNFLSIVNIPIINRIGLRYIDECPMPAERNNDSFKTFYDTSFPLHRFELADAEEMATRAVVRKDKYRMCYMERIVKKENEWKLVLDFDGFAHEIPAEDYLTTTDALHEIISNEFHKTIKEPVYRHMRQEME